MQAKNFQSISKFLSWFFKISAGLSIIGAILALASYFLDFQTFDNLSFVVLEMDSSFSLLVDDQSITQLEYAKAGLLTAPLFLGLMSYLFIQSSRLFDRLVRGESPFTVKFSEKVKKISYLLAITDVTVPLFYSLLVNLIAETGSYFYLGLSHWMLIALILYVVSGILNYGISLQELSDETV